MASGKNDAALRKRQQIDSSKKTMFMTVAVAAFAVGIALVVAFFLVQQILFHSKVIGAKQQAIDTIKRNIETADDLKDNIRVLDTNPALNSVKLNEQSSAVQVILDALPAEANADALGASLQVRFVGTTNGVVVESLSVDGEGVISEEVAVDDSVDDSAANRVGFNLVVSGPVDSLKELLAKFERSIRVIELTSVELQAGTSGLTMSVAGYAYYEPAQTVEIGTKVVKP
ncbi:hypothetical protein B7Z00_00070 [Candidatus Saccharibacteria bacterium 32-50-10]|nr:MAG: hypothetical protein B7Z00_00070 [Candidatus Saccharibacteria bacterium 32-50-10]